MSDRRAGQVPIFRKHRQNGNGMILLWIIAVMGIVYFLWWHLLPFIYTKLVFFILSIKIKRMAKRYDGETREKLLHIGKGLKDISKEEEL